MRTPRSRKIGGGRHPQRHEFLVQDGIRLGPGLLRHRMYSEQLFDRQSGIVAEALAGRGRLLGGMPGVPELMPGNRFKELALGRIKAMVGNAC
jgi:hypothetical protein